MLIIDFKNPWSKDNSPWFNEEKDGRFNSKSTTSKRPSWNDVYAGYPKTNNGSDDLPADKVFTSILGSNYDKSIFTNACATRVSLGLLNAGMNVKKSFLISKGKFKGKGFIASAIDLKNWLSLPEIWGNPDDTIEGPSDITDVRNQLKSRNGVYIIIGGFSGGVSGHATLWIGKDKDVIGGHNYISYGGTIYFWELK